MGSWHFDLRTGEGHGSEELYRLHGLDPARARLDFASILDGVHRADQRRVRAAVKRLAESGEQFGDEFRIVRPDGRIRWVRAELVGTRDETGLVVAIQGTVQDITEAKLAEEALRERERQLAEAQCVARMGSWEVDLATGQVTWSEAMRRLWRFEEGTSTPSLEGLLARLHPEDVPRMLRVREHLLAGGEPTSVHVRAKCSDGAERWFAARSANVLGEQGAPIRLCGTARDITAEKGAELARRADEERHRPIVETTYGGLWMTDAEGKTTYVNARMAEMLGYSVEEMLRQPVASLVAEKDRHVVSTNVSRRRSGISEQYEVTLLGKGKTEVRALVVASPLVDDDDRYSGSLALVSDVTGWRAGADSPVPNDERHD